MFRLFSTLFSRGSLALEPMTRPAFVLGSGPNSRPPNMDRSDFIFATVNASQVVARSWNLGKPDLTLFGAGVLGDKPVNIAAKSVLTGQQTNTLLFIGRESERTFVERQTTSIQYDYQRLLMLSRSDRRRLIKKVTHINCNDNQQPSNGLFLAILCVYLGSPEVIMSGFSLTVSGHAYNDFGHPRSRTLIDLKIIQSIVKRKLNVFTNDATFSGESGLPLNR